MKKLRRGFTTGTAAAAAAKAAAIRLSTGVLPDKVAVKTPPGKIIEIPVSEPGQQSVKLISGKEPDSYAASVIKDGGDDPDVTSGLEITARVRSIDTETASLSLCSGEGDLLIKGGEGVGVVTRPGLQVPVGEPAINPAPQEMIRHAVRDVLPEGAFEVEVLVPGGKEAAEKTFNSRLGIVGGISIIGTTGIVEPMSLDAMKATIKCEIDVAVAENRGQGAVGSSQRTEGGSRKTDNGPSSILRTQYSKLLYFAPGKIGEDALRREFGDVRVIMMSNFIGFSLEYAAECGVRDIVLGGHPGKLAKVLMGHLDTHSSNSPQANDFVAGYLGVAGKFNTVEEIVQGINTGLLKPARGLSDLASEVAVKLKGIYNFRSVSVYLYDMKRVCAGGGNA